MYYLKIYNGYCPVCFVYRILRDPLLKNSMIYSFYYKAYFTLVLAFWRINRLKLLMFDIWKCYPNWIACVFLKWVSIHLLHNFYPLTSFPFLVFCLCYCSVLTPKLFSFSLSVLILWRYRSIVTLKSCFVIKCFLYEELMIAWC